MPTHPPQLHIADHPLIAHLLADLRDKATPPDRMRSIVRRLGTLLAYEATRDLPTDHHTVTTPIQPCDAQRLHHNITIVPILRAGLPLAEPILDLFPNARMGHLGMYRDEKTLQPTTYYQRLPPNTPDAPVLLVDPMLATGGSADAALTYLKSQHCTDTRLICLVAAPPGLDRITKNHPNTPIHTAALDSHLDHRGYIVPGLGDAGDRLYATT